MNNYSMFLPSYTIGENAYNEINSICSVYGKTAVVVGGYKAMAAAKTHFERALGGKGIVITDYIHFGGECSYGNVSTMAANKTIMKADMIFAVGGGKATDTCKCIGEMLDKPVFAFPTIASNCSCCTSVSIMYTAEGVFVEPHFLEKPPIHTFINTRIISESPTKYMWAGIGDTYAKFYEAEVSSRGEDLEHFTDLGVTMSPMCVNPLLKYGKIALENNKACIASYELQQVVLAITVSTALVSIFVTRDHTPDYNSGLAHAIYYALTSIREIEENHLHGEVVAFGVLILLLCDENYDEFERVYAFNKSVSLPTSLSAIGITDAQMAAIIPKIPAMGDIKHYPYKVTEEMLEKAFAELKKYGERGSF
ncbi:MAG: iron-containing alcohol dehydrogenase family protein [Firmicutes bacterium]|nr:iron-containing alcohol dehydrogenase family protein [Bacillota bacterium]